MSSTIALMCASSAATAVFILREEIKAAVLIEQNTEKDTDFTFVASCIAVIVWAICAKFVAWCGFKKGIGMVVMDAPLVLGFCGVCFVIQWISTNIYPGLNSKYFSMLPLASSSMLSPLFYLRLFSHCLGHASWTHLSGNLSIITIVGPTCEMAFGTWPLMVFMLLTAFSTGFVHYATILAGLQIDRAVMGASGLLFMLLVLAPSRDHPEGKIRASFIFLMFFWVWKEFVGIVGAANDGISHEAHAVGAVVGGLVGLLAKETSLLDRIKQCKSSA